VIAVVGYESLFAILSNLVAIIAYWTIIYFALVAEEHILFRRKIGYKLDAWDNANLLPKGYAAMLPFFVGAVGSVVGMAETWYIGPIGAMIGASGGDLGVELGFGFAAVIYPGLRYMELKKYGR
jgi:purine-cytosine permease-like protein